MNSEVNWVLKITKLCNLRCKYCYEWSDLHKRDRFSLHQWEDLISNIIAYHSLRLERFGALDTVNFIWHGGEPLLLGHKYISEVCNLQREMIGDRFSFNNLMQTNLYALSDEMIDTLKKNKFGIGVSFDAASGVRLSLGGNSTEAKVISNINRLRKHGMRLGGICVLGKHNYEYLEDIFNFFVSNKIPFRLLRLRDSPNVDERGSYELTREQSLNSFKKIVDLVLEMDEHVDVSPIDGLIQAAIRRKHGLLKGWHDRKKYGDSLFVVNTNGDLYCHRDAYKVNLRLGNIFSERISDILQSPAFSDSLKRDGDLIERVCKECKSFQYCDSLPALNDEKAFDETPYCDISEELIEYCMYKISETNLRPILAGAASQISISEKRMRPCSTI